MTELLVFFVALAAYFITRTRAGAPGFKVSAGPPKRKEAVSRLPTMPYASEAERRSHYSY